MHKSTPYDLLIPMEAPLHLCWEGEITDDEAPRCMDDSQSSQQSSAPDELEATTTALDSSRFYRVRGLITPTLVGAALDIPSYVGA